MQIDEEKFGVKLNNYKLLTQKEIPTNKECYICLKNFKKNGKVRQLPCGHLFCNSCLQPWLKTNSTCPTCKFELKHENEDEKDDY